MKDETKDELPEELKGLMALIKKKLAGHLGTCTCERCKAQARETAIRTEASDLFSSLMGKMGVQSQNPPDYKSLISHAFLAAECFVDIASQRVQTIDEKFQDKNNPYDE
jgi:hypothetical protein